MSRRHDVQDAQGVVVAITPAQASYVIKSAVPTNGVPGFMPGCFWQNRNGTAGSLFYINTGSATSATWLNIA